MNRRLAFTIPVGAGSYAPEILYLSRDQNSLSGLSVPQSFDPIGRCRVLVHAPLIATVTIELDLLNLGGNPAVAADWELATASMTLVGPSVLLDLVGHRGARLRAKSGGTAGTQNVGVDWTLEREG